MKNEGETQPSVSHFWLDGTRKLNGQALHLDEYNGEMLDKSLITNLLVASTLKS